MQLFIAKSECPSDISARFDKHLQVFFTAPVLNRKVLVDYSDSTSNILKRNTLVAGILSFRDNFQVLFGNFMQLHPLKVRDFRFI